MIVHIFRSSQYTGHHRTVFKEKAEAMSVNGTTLVGNEEHIFKRQEGESSLWNDVLSLQLIRSSFQAAFLSKRRALAKYEIECPCQIHP